MKAREFSENTVFLFPGSQQFRRRKQDSGQGTRREVVVKAQVHIGGRGKAGGLSLLLTLRKPKKAAEILGMDIGAIQLKEFI